MSRDSLLYTLIGLLVGFIAGFMLHESMASRQPAPSFVGMAEQIGAGAAPQSPAPRVGGANGPQDSMQQVQRLRQYVEENPGDLEALKVLANLNLSIRNLSRASELFERYVQQKGDDLEVLQAYGNLSYDQQAWPKAAELYEAFLEISPSDHGVRTDLGAVYRYLGRYEDALAEFERVLQARPDHWEARFNEVLVKTVDLRDYDGADRALKELRILRPGDPSVERLAAELERRRQGA